MAAAAVLVTGPVHAQRGPVWPDALLTRTQALALVQGLNAEILASRSATATLEKWCGDHALAREPRMVAEVLAGEPRAPTAEQRRRLQADSGEVVRYRRVRLRCGGHVLSEAENWYLPGRLTPEMNRALETGNTPFGRVVAPLSPDLRRTAPLVAAAGGVGACAPLRAAVPQLRPAAHPRRALRAPRDPARP
jgi:chorismate-pyruvate lyase